MLKSLAMRGRMLVGSAIAMTAALALVAAHPPAALSQASGGLWEIEGSPELKTPVRECIADLATLAQFEHRGRTCSRSVIDDAPGSTTIRYSCDAADFGRTKIDVLTPRSLRISTQGISGNLPFNYVVQARRVGDCVKNPSSPRH